MFSGEKREIPEKLSASGQCRTQVFRGTWLARSELPTEYERELNTEHSQYSTASGLCDHRI